MSELDRRQALINEGCPAMFRCRIRATGVTGFLSTNYRNPALHFLTIHYDEGYPETLGFTADEIELVSESPVSLYRQQINMSLPPPTSLPQAPMNLPQAPMILPQLSTLIRPIEDSIMPGIGELVTKDGAGIWQITVIRGGGMYDIRDCKNGTTERVPLSRISRLNLDPVIQNHIVIARSRIDSLEEEVARLRASLESSQALNKRLAETIIARAEPTGVCF